MTKSTEHVTLLILHWHHHLIVFLKYKLLTLLHVLLIGFLIFQTFVVSNATLKLLYYFRYLQKYANTGCLLLLANNWKLQNTYLCYLLNRKLIYARFYNFGLFYNKKKTNLPNMLLTLNCLYRLDILGLLFICFILSCMYVYIF